MFACLWDPDREPGRDAALLDLARGFSPRVARRGPGRVVLEASGLARLFGELPALGAALGRAAAKRGWAVQVALAPSCAAAELIALGRGGVTVVAAPAEAARVLATLPLEVLARWVEGGGKPTGRPDRAARPTMPGAVLQGAAVASALVTLARWGVRTLGELAALPRPDLFARLGPLGLDLQRLARGEELLPFVPEEEAELFEATVEFDWPLDRLDPLLLAFDRALAPLVARLERAAAGVARLELHLRLTTREWLVRTLELPVPLRDPGVLRMLVRLDLETHLAAHRGGPRGHHRRGPAGRLGGELPGIEALRVRIDPAPARIVQGSLLARTQPVAERLATLVARLKALLGDGRVGAPGLVDSYRPGAFVVHPFNPGAEVAETDAVPVSRLVLGVRRLRVPVPARVALEQGRPVDVRVGYPVSGGGRVVACAGPWRTSGHWWEPGDGGHSLRASTVRPWDRDEWDVLASDGGLYRLFRDRITNRWFVEGLID